MKLTLLSLLALIPSSLGHYMITQVFINGEAELPGKCLRTPPTTSPITDLNSNAMACNWNGNTAVPRACPLTAGSTITLLWRSHPDASAPGSIPDGSHQGPCAAYLKRVDTVTSASASGGGWFKIFEEGFRDGKWCSDRIAENGGRMTVRIPSDLKQGEYLLRGEQVALHMAEKKGGAQFYIGCAQLLITSAGQKTQPKYVSIPGYIKYGDPGTIVPNMWEPKYLRPKNYKVPGPAVFNPPVNRDAIKGPKLKEVGFENCGLENANWCARPVGGFKNEGECYAASGKCWQQLTQCYNEAPATGNSGCRKYEELCEKANKHCGECGSKDKCKGPKFPGINI